MSSPSTRARKLFLSLCVACVLAVAVFAVVRRSRLAPDRNPPIAASQTKPLPVSKAAAAPQPHETVTAELPSKEERPSIPARTPSPLIYFRANALNDSYGKLAVSQIDALDQVRYASSMTCDRVHFSGSKGVCLASDRGVFTTYSAVMFDDQLRPGWSRKLNGIPSRVRVSPSGRLAAITVFLSGHSYTSASFSTETTILDTSSGEALIDLEKFSVTRNGSPFQSPDFNFWGVTFARDENRFYATLSSKGKTYLVKCDLAKRTAEVIHEDVECPSLSPDNSRIAFKKRTGPITWRIWLLDLKTLTETPLNETRNVDDQVEWLDANHVLYALPEDLKASSPTTDVWSLSIDSAGAPELLVKGAFSPAVVQRQVQTR